jgi:hypothetical protein
MSEERDSQRGARIVPRQRGEANGDKAGGEDRLLGMPKPEVPAAAARYFGDDLSLSEAFLRHVDPLRPFTLPPFLWRHVAPGAGAWAKLRTAAEAVPAFLSAVVAHCEVVELFAQALGLDPSVRDALRVGEERWNGQGLPGRLREDAIPEATRVVQVAEAIVLGAHSLGEAEVPRLVRARSGKLLDPKVSATASQEMGQLLALARSFDLRDRDLRAEPTPHAVLTPESLDAGLSALGGMADLKAAYATGH